MYKISCIHPTCRPELAKKTRKKWLKLAKNSSQIEYITCYDSFDKKKIKQKVLRNKNITGKEAEENLGKADITINKNMVPFDTESPFVTSGMRIGTAAITTRGMEEDDMKKIVDFIDRVICDTSEIEAVKKEINEWANNFPLHK